MHTITTVSYTHLRAHETPEHLVCRLLLEKKKTKNNATKTNNRTRQTIEQIERKTQIDRHINNIQ